MKLSSACSPAPASASGLGDAMRRPMYAVPATEPAGSAAMRAVMAERADRGEMPIHADGGGPGSPYEAELEKGFRFLRFSGPLEAQFHKDKEAERASLLRVGMGFALFLVLGMLVSDWLMVPDMFHQAWQMRLGFYALPVVAWLLSYERLDLRWRERFCVFSSLPAAAIPAWLSVHSRDELAPAYLVSVALVLLFNGGVIRLRFWNALVANVLVLAAFGFAVLQLDPIPAVLMSAIALVLVSTMAFSLHGSYCLELEDRTNWLMLQHEHLLLSEIEQGNRRLDELSRHDALTGLANRRHVDEFLQHVWDRARQDGDEVSLLMMDIDHFKAFNDRYGHPEGDACLRDVAETMAMCLRQPGDLVGRFGGEEFIAVLNRTGLGSATVAAERVREGVRQLARQHAASGTADVVTVSIGAACVRPGLHERSPERLIALADRALYRAKSAGRDRVASLSDQG
ncbi:MAG: diguanylate cyclase [Aquabacterium sp.]